jgi:hypothetical protein
LRIAREDATKNFAGIEHYPTTSCVQGPFWRVYFEPLDIQRSPAVFEIIVSKKPAFVVERRELSLRLGWTNTSIRPLQPMGVDRANAINIAQKDAAKASRHLTRFRLTVCELKNTWRVIFAPEEWLNGGGPEYLIDKSNGRILNKKYYQ